MRILYSLIYTLAFLLILPYFLVVGLFRKKYLQSASQRFGFIPQKSTKPSCWIHAVSVGEFLAAKPLIRKIQEMFPDLPLFVSTTTITGQKLAAEFLPGHSFYFPFDWHWSLRRVFTAINPKMILVMETEIWPNFIWMAQDRDVPVVLINGRISDKSFQRYKAVRGFLPAFSESWMQTDEDAIRMKAIVKDSRTVRVMGNLKFDYSPHTISPGLKTLLGNWKRESLLIIAGSTMNGEEEILLDAFNQLSSTFDVKILIAPRHPERFSDVFTIAAEKGFNVVRRSTNTTGNERIMILDTIGELAAAYDLADLVFIGGTFSYGGHNPIEPAFYGKAIVSGRRYENFRAIFEEFIDHDALMVTTDLHNALAKLLQDQNRREKMGKAAQELIRKNQGAADFVLQNIRKYLDDRNVMEPGTKSSVR
jgi:3-deoxy-D-manno-octulosonic-acid transferase